MTMRQRQGGLLHPARWWVFAMLLGLGGCGIKQVSRKLVLPANAETLDGKSPYLKAHLRSGAVYVLQSWRFDATTRSLTGSGQLLSPNRTTLASGSFAFSPDSVALFETNVLKSGGANAALTVMAGITAAVAGYCLSNPKACFGSCPTFYLGESPDAYLQAEGFSASIAPALEATDVDALSRAVVRPGRFTLRMTNEALETHVVRYVRLLAVPRPSGGRVFQSSDGRFRSAMSVIPPTGCRDEAGDCTGQILAEDSAERTSLADSTDLARRETIELTFDPSPGAELGVVVTARQSLLSTYLLYQGLAYLGSRATQMLARIDSSTQVDGSAPGFGQLLGRVEVQVLDAHGGWRTAGETGEVGPLAPDTRLVPIPTLTAGPIRIRLRMTRGLWRIDRVALARLGPAVSPLRLAPVAVRREGRPDQGALALLRDSVNALVTLPGDAYAIDFDLPPAAAEWELFLETRGYYLEWMRREWLSEEDPMLAARLLLDPAGMLRTMAPAYKAVEPEMEAAFWSSRYARP
jgi:hypothetical protein